MFMANMYGTPNAMAGDAMGTGFMTGNEWELGGVGGGSGMTPMSDGGWNQMIDNLGLGWDNMGSSHTTAQGR